mmetsp:Transcript_50671/g.151591  ORF Transcript_50671/g.151591 Transcript_50671/m.151591 type:complete len:298 (+) Transcript_50671:141-1034(+)
MFGKPCHDRVLWLEVMKEQEERKRSIKGTETILHDSLQRLSMCQRRVDRAARRGRQRQTNQCLSAPHKSNGAERRAALVRDLQRRTRDFRQEAENEGLELTAEDEALLEEVVATNPELRAELEAALDTSKRRPKSAAPVARQGSTASLPSPSPAKTETSDAVISTFLEHLGPMEPLTPLSLSGSQPEIRKSKSTGALDRAAWRRRRKDQLVESPDSAGEVRRVWTNPSTPVASRRSFSRLTTPSSCGGYPQARGRRAAWEESTRRRPIPSSPGSVSSVSSSGSPKYGAAVMRTLFQN